MSKRTVEGLGLRTPNQHILPLTQDDLINDPQSPSPNVINGNNFNDRPDDLYSIANSIQSSVASSSLSTFAKQARINKLHKKKYMNPNGSSSSSYSSRFNLNFKIPVYFKKLIRPPSLDFETAIWEMINLISQPKRVYRSLYYQKQTKNTWSRDDPSFVILLSLLLTISALCWGLTYTPGVLSILKLMLYMVIVDFLITGSVVATIGWILANNLFEKKPTGVQSFNSSFNSPNPGSSSSLTSSLPFASSAIFAKIYNSKVVQFCFNLIPRDSVLEWTYCFDIHCNAYLAIWLALYLVQFVFLPLLRLNNWFSTLIGNTLYLSSSCYYFIITFYGYNSLPFLQRTEYLLLPIPIFIIVYLFLTFTGVNVANYMCDLYFN